MTAAPGAPATAPSHVTRAAGLWFDGTGAFASVVSAAPPTLG